jgi:AraC-like DNA-binding protein
MDVLPQLHSVPAHGESARGCRPRARRAHPGLRRLVLGYAGFGRPGATPLAHRLMPLAATVLIIDVDRGVGLVTGPRATGSVCDRQRWGHGVTIGLSPAGVSALLAVPSADLAEGVLSLADVCGTRAAELVDRLAAAPTWEARCATLDRLLLPHATTDDTLADAAWRRLHRDAGRGSHRDAGRGLHRDAGRGLHRDAGRGLHRDAGRGSREGAGRGLREVEPPGHPHGPAGGAGHDAGRGPHRGHPSRSPLDGVGPGRDRDGIPDVAAALGVSRRRLETLCRAHLGHSPGRIARIARFQRAVGLILRGLPLAMVAAQAGYADQPHLTRESVALAGLTPGTLCTILQDATGVRR